MARCNNKVTFVTLTLLLLASIFAGFKVTNAQIERVTTSCAIFVDNTVEGHPITAIIQMSPATPTGEGYTRLIVYLKSPNGVGPSSPNGPWVYTNVPTDQNGKATVTFNVPTYSGKWYIFVDFGGQSYFNYSKFYVGGTWQTEFTVSAIKTPAPSTSAALTASPTSIMDSTPNSLATPSTIALPKNYTIPPLSSLNLKVNLHYGLGPIGGCSGLIHVKGGSGNDINFRVFNPQGKTVLDLGRISNETKFYISPDQTGNYTVLLDNEFSVISSKEVEVFSYSYPDNLFWFDGFSFNFWVIILVVILFGILIASLVGLYRHKQDVNSNFVGVL